MKVNDEVKTPVLDCIVALNTLHSFKCASAKGVYFNSPDPDYFEGSAEGYWQKLARELGATDSELGATDEISNS